MPYIPQFNKLSLNELAYAPSLMRKQHDEQVASQMELAEALKFDYLKQDAEGIEPVLQKYNADIEDVSKQIAQQGFSQDLKNKVLGLRSQYVGDDKIRTYKKNYSDAMSQWDEQRKRMIQEGRSGDQINRQKAAFFSGYQGAYSPEGLKNEFTAGRTSGNYDIGDYALKAASKLGHTGTTINGGRDSLTPRKDPTTGDTYYEVRNVSDGKLITNISQVDAIKKYVKDQFNTEGTDENLFAKIEGLTPEHINETVENVLNSQLIRDETAPKGSSSFTGFTKGAQAPARSSYSEYTNLRKGEGDPDDISDEDALLLSGVDSKSKSFSPDKVAENIAIADKYSKAAASITPDAFAAATAGSGYESSFNKASNKVTAPAMDKAKKAFDARKAEYKTVYDFMQKQGATDEDFINATSALKRNAVAELTTNVGFDDPDALKNLWGKVWENPKQATFTKMSELNSNKPKIETFGSDPITLSVEDMNKKIEKAGLSREEFFNRQTTIDSDGNVHFQLNGEEFSVNKETIPRQATGFDKTFSTLKKMATDPKLSVSEINKIAQQEFEIGNKVFFFEVDPDNPFNRQLMVQDNLGLSDPVPVKLAAVQAEIAKQTHRGISNTNKID